jgi:hypothetical protein
MKSLEMKSKLASLPELQRAICFDAFAHELTVTGRDPDLWGNTSGTRRHSDVLAAILEMVHVVTGQVRKLLLKDTERYPDDVVIDIVFDHARRVGVESAIERSFERVRL